MKAGGRLEVLRRGRWSSAGSLGYVWIIRQDWDYYHEDFHDEGPDLSKEGWAYYALYGTDPDIAQHSSRSPTCLSESEAIKRAEAALVLLKWE